jgi:hypothetical protein
MPEHIFLNKKKKRLYLLIFFCLLYCHVNQLEQRLSHGFLNPISLCSCQKHLIAPIIVKWCHRHQGFCPKRLLKRRLLKQKDQF